MSLFHYIKLHSIRSSKYNVPLNIMEQIITQLFCVLFVQTMKTLFCSSVSVKIQLLFELP